MKTQLTLAFVAFSSLALGACARDVPCTTSAPSGPIRVIIDCVDEARSDSAALGEEPLVVEYKNPNGDWHLCRGVEFPDGWPPYTETSFTEQLCSHSSSQSFLFECGDLGYLGTFEIRARQGARSAGPIEVSDRYAYDGCGSNLGSLRYELSLDVEE